MTRSSPENIVRMFGMSGLMVESDLRRIAERHDVPLRTANSKKTTDQVYYPQFDHAVRAEARGMAEHYEVFYCLEKSIRKLIADKLEDTHGPDWWDSCVPEQVALNVKKAVKREQDSGVTRRSAEQIDYSTFGELGEIIKCNWTEFGDTFESRKALEKVLSTLNVIRGPIAHCSPLAEDEVVRLELAVRDWFRLME